MAHPFRSDDRQGGDHVAGDDAARVRHRAADDHTRLSLIDAGLRRAAHQQDLAAQLIPLVRREVAGQCDAGHAGHRQTQQRVWFEWDADLTVPPRGLDDGQGPDDAALVIFFRSFPQLLVNAAAELLQYEDPEYLFPHVRLFQTAQHVLLRLHADQLLRHSGPLQ